MRPGKRSLRPEVDAIIHHAVVTKLGTAGNCSVRAVYEVVRTDCDAIGRSAPSRSTILDRIKALKAAPEILPTAIRRKLVDRTRPVRGSANASKALEEVQIDHTLVDQHVVDCRDGQPLGRPWLTLAIDTVTRVILRLRAHT